MKRLLALLLALALLPVLSAAEAYDEEADLYIEEIIEDVDLDAEESGETLPSSGDAAWTFPIPLEEMDPSLIVLANKHYKLDKSFVPEDLVKVPRENKGGIAWAVAPKNGQQLRQVCSDALSEMNAAIKAEAVCAATGFPAIADDSGLCVDALDGEPGVLSARYAGEHGDDEANNDLLLRRMEGKEDRRARFMCALALKFPGKEPIIAEGSCPGTSLYKRQGTGGFGYDPLFLYEPMGKTYAEMNETEKNEISHRARAAREMAKIMAKICAEGKPAGNP